MSDPVEPLIADLLEWLAKEPRTYSDVMDAWRTSCPRLPIWEEANDRGYVTREWHDGEARVGIAPAGQAFLETARTRPRTRLSA